MSSEPLLSYVNKSKESFKTLYTPIGNSEDSDIPDNDQIDQMIINKYSIGPFVYVIKDKKPIKFPVYNPLIKKYGSLNFLEEKERFLTQLDTSDLDMAKQGFYSLEQMLVKVHRYLQGKKSKNPYSSTLLDQMDQIAPNNNDILLWSYVTGLRKLIPMLIDPFLEEIYIIPPYGNIIVDHQQYGRMNTELTFSWKESIQFLHRVAIENISELSQLKPSIRGDLRVNGLFLLRVTGDIPPFAQDGPIINIRKLQSKPFSLKFLVKNQTIDLATAAFLKLSVQKGVSVTIVGNPGSGKTTLQTALLQELPTHWRVLSLEQAVEANVKLPQFLRYKHFNYVSQLHSQSRSTIVSQFLHRSPDYVNLGEITTSDEAISWYHLLSAGIPVIQTIHGTSMQAIIPRITEVFNIPSSLIASSLPHIIVEIKRFWHKNLKTRKVVAIAELTFQDNEKIEIQPLTLFDTKKRCLKWHISPNNSYSINLLQKYRNFNLNRELERLASSFH
ncbi:MAG: ATPase, T2SS/T4P/T4SS family [Candidatus Hodarchaeales archaeon]|jgi:type IV secretory pathway ATPase VirB11/archaellum biosynthesis ATPase